jgi:hypothetical protein
VIGDPNLWWGDNYPLVARRDIVADAELTNDYATSTGDEGLRRWLQSRFDQIGYDHRRLTDLAPEPPPPRTERAEVATSRRDLRVITDRAGSASLDRIRRMIDWREDRIGAAQRGEPSAA